MLTRPVIVTLSLCLTLCATQPALAAGPGSIRIGVTQQQPRPRMLQRIQVKLGRLWSTTLHRTAAWAQRWIADRQVNDTDRHLQPLRQMLRSGRISQRDHDRVLSALGQPHGVDKAAQARQRLERAAGQKKHLRPLVQMIKRGELSDADILRVERLFR